MNFEDEIDMLLARDERTRFDMLDMINSNVRLGFTIYETAQMETYKELEKKSDRIQQRLETIILGRIL